MCFPFSGGQGYEDCCVDFISLFWHRSIFLHHVHHVWHICFSCKNISYSNFSVAMCIVHAKQNTYAPHFCDVCILSAIFVQLYWRRALSSSSSLIAANLTRKSFQKRYGKKKSWCWICNFVSVIVIVVLTPNRFTAIFAKTSHYCKCVPAPASHHPATGMVWSPLQECRPWPPSLPFMRFRVLIVSSTSRQIWSVFIALLRALILKLCMFSLWQLTLTRLLSWSM